jgi:hypothetical protein
MDFLPACPLVFCSCAIPMKSAAHPAPATNRAQASVR